MNKYKPYNYKIQFLFKKEDVFKRDFVYFIKFLGVRWLDCIYLRDYDFKAVDIYNKYISLPSGLAEYQTIKDLRRILKKNNKIKYVELIKK